MTEQDLFLKAATRSLFWRMGLTTRIDVPLRVPVRSAGRGRATNETLTDLDVLGIGVSTSLSVESAIADCKTSQRGSTERMFWIRGVADFFGAGDLYMVRATDVTAAARQLASRLSIAVVTPADLAALESHYSTPNRATGVEFLFDPAEIAEYRKALTSIDRKLQSLREYQEFDFWIYDEHRNLLQAVAHLNAVRQSLSPSNPIHRALFYESAWLYLLAVTRAAEYVRRTHVTELDTSLRQYLFGGQLGLREKQRMAEVLRKATGRDDAADANEGVFPTYFGAMLELTTRILRRPEHVANALRYAEWAAEAAVAKVDEPASECFGASFDDLGAKLAGDTCAFLVTAAGLDKDFRDRARSTFAPQTASSEAPLAQGTLPISDSDTGSHGG